METQKKGKLPKVNISPRGGVYHYSFTHDGVRYRETTGQRDRSKAQMVAERIRNQIVRDQLGAFDPLLSPSSLVFEKFFEIKTLDRREENTLASYRRYLARFDKFFGENVRLTDLDRYQVEDWKKWLLAQPVENNQNRKKDNPATLSFRSVTEHLNWLASVYTEFEIPNPCKRVRRPRKKPIEEQQALQCFTKEEMEALFDCADRERKLSKASFHDKAFFWWLVLLGHTGMRLGEAQGIRFCDIDKDLTRVWVFADKPDRGRWVNLEAPVVTEKVIEHPAERSSWFAITMLWKLAEDFYREAGIEYTQETVLHFTGSRWLYKRLQKLCDNAGVRRLKAHAIRHTVASHLLPVLGTYEVGKILGHQGEDTVYRVYGHQLPNKTPRLRYKEENAVDTP